MGLGQKNYYLVSNLARSADSQTVLFNLDIFY